jgi:signal peptidase II
MGTKVLTQENLSPISWQRYEYPYGGIGMFQNFFGIEFSIVYAKNRGAAWGVLANYSSYLFAFRLFLVMSLVVYFACINRRSSWRFPLVLIIAGALGNIIDYFLHGHVTDMFHFILWGYDFPVFNIADSAITIGIAWLFLSSFFEKADPVHDN